jgi:transcriptional regulator with XRE-family HTH domain
MVKAPEGLASVGSSASDLFSRSCARCGRPLSRYNKADYCSGCASGAASGPRSASSGAASIGPRVRAARLRRGLTLQVLGDMCGVSAAYLSMVENGKRPVDRYSLIVELAGALQVPAAELAPDLLAGFDPAASRTGTVGGPDEGGGVTGSTQQPLNWCTDPLTDLASLGNMDLHADADRRRLLSGAVYSAATVALPDPAWWQSEAGLVVAPAAGKQRAGPDDVAAVRQLGVVFSRLDQLRGGGHARKAVVQYLRSDATALLTSRFACDQVRREMFSAVAELAYLSGWMAFDNSEHAMAHRYLCLALKLAARAGDPPLAGHILRAMAHQALDLGFRDQGLELAATSVHGQRYLSASPRERALLGVVHARALAATGQKQAAAKALLKAEDDLAVAREGIAEPPRTFFFGEASLAHEAGRTLQSCGDQPGAVRHFQHSVRSRGTAFRRTHAVTLGYLGAAQMASGNLDEACAAWSQTLDIVEDGSISSGRARQAIMDMRCLIAPVRDRVAAVTAIDERAAAYLAETSSPA